MARNKSPEADLEHKRGIFFQIGLATAIAAAFMVINYETPVPDMEDSTIQISGLEIEVISQDCDSSSVIMPPEPNFEKK